MTDMMNVVRERRSTRKFEQKEVSEEQLNTLLEAAQYAQSWANTQCWEIIIVRDQKIRTELRETMLKGNPATRAIENAPLLLATCAKLKSSGYYKGEAPTKFGDWFMFDMGIVNQNLCLAAHAMGLGFVPIRKKGKLPGSTIREDYELEYGIDSIEIHVDAVEKGQRVLLVDDLLATGGTALGACRLLERTGAEVYEACFIVDLPDLNGSKRLEEHGVKWFALVDFEGE